MKTIFKTKLLCFLALCTVLNVVGGMLALTLRLPVYLDMIGTVFSAALAGPVYGMLPGLFSGLIGFLTTDPFALYYIPVQLVTGILSGLCFHLLQTRKKWFPVGIAAVTFPGTAVSSLITVVLFGGITSSGSSLLVQLFHQLGLGLTASVVLVQFFTDYLDRFLAFVVVSLLLSVLPGALLDGIRIKQPKR